MSLDLTKGSITRRLLLFALPLMIGMASGLYTSLFLATGLWVEWEQRHPAKGAKARK